MSDPVHDGHTVDVGYVHTLTAPGGPCTDDCPHPSHEAVVVSRAELDGLRAENALLRGAFGPGVSTLELRALVAARQRREAIVDLEAQARAWQQIAGEFESHVENCGCDPCETCEIIGAAVNAAEERIRGALARLDASS